MDILGWLGSLNWGDIPSWLSIALTLGVAGLAYAKRAGIMVWFKRTFNAPPDFDSQPSWTMTQGPGPKKDAITLKNLGLGIAYDVRAEAHDWGWETIHFKSQYNFDSIRPNESVDLQLPFIPESDGCQFKISWILRDGERTSKQWDLRGYDFGNVEHPF